MCSTSTHIAGRYNKYSRNLSQSPWIDKNDTRIKHSVQELIEDGLNKYLNFGKSVFSASGREDVDVKMLGRGRPFVFRIIEPMYPQEFKDKHILRQIENYINSKHGKKIEVRDLQFVTKDDIDKYMRDEEEDKTKEYRALCCCSRRLSEDDMIRINSIENLELEQKTPVRVLHRRSLTTRRRKIYSMRIERAKLNDSEKLKEDELDRAYILTLKTEAGTYIKEFVHGDFGRTKPNLGALLKDCEADLVELDVLQVHLDWPPSLEMSKLTDKGNTCSHDHNDEVVDETSLENLYKLATKLVKDAESMQRGIARQKCYSEARKSFENAMKLVGSLSLFSDNETLDDVATANIKYLLIPAHTAKVILSAECGQDRLKTFLEAEEYLKNFLKSVINYGLADLAIERAMSSESNEPISLGGFSSLESAAASRNEKIERYKRMKVLESHIEELNRRIEQSESVDDEVAREYYISLLKKSISDSLETLEREVRPAIYFEKNRASGIAAETPASTSSEARKKIVPETLTLVKDNMQKQVFGIGYPSRPTVTVDEFISKKMKDGDLAFTAHKEVYSNSLQRYAEQPNLRREQDEMVDIEQEQKEERDDAEELERKRQWDEFKDETPRGSGNRHNMG